MQFKNNVPWIRDGLETSKIAFSGGRLTASIANHGGLTVIDYYGEQRFGDSSFFAGNAISAWTQLFRLCLGVGDNLYYLEFSDTGIFPFGYTSHFSAEGVAVRHGLYLLNDALVYRIEVLRNPKKHAISAVVFQMNGVTAVTKPTRQWTGFDRISPANNWEGAAVDQHEDESTSICRLSGATFSTHQVKRSETRVALTSDRAFKFECENPFKHRLHTARFAKDATICLAFGHGDQAAFHHRLAGLRKSAKSEVNKLLASHRESLHQPDVTIPNKSFQSFLANTRAMVEAMVPKDVPGGPRGANNGYWIWGWDALVFGHSYSLARDPKLVVDMLALFRRLSHPEVGIAHSITLDMKPFLPMAANAQTLYSIFLYDAYLHSGDKKLLREYFDFAGSFVDRAGKEEIGDSGLVRGLSLYPDAVDTLGENGDDASAINNSIYYQALRCMQTLALELGEQAKVADWKARADRLQKSFARFYDSKVGFFYASISASDFKPRVFYGGHAIFWTTAFAQDLVEPHVEEVARFMVTELRMRHGYRLMPKWDAGYMRDGNNNGYYDPYVDRFYLEMMKQTRRTKEIQRFMDDVKWYWDQLTVPEAMGCEMENHGITVDDVGKHQLFSMKVWWSIFFHDLAGIGIDSEGLTFTACDCGNIDVKDLRIRGRRIDLKITGTGWEIGKLLLNGKPVAAPFRIPFSSLKKHSHIEVRRTSKKAASKSRTNRS